MSRKLSSVWLAVVGVLWLASPAYLATHDFYKGKTIRLIVAFSAGGAFDAYSRTIARHLSKHVPGNPTVIVENMTGAGGFIHANYMYQRAKPDGLTIGNNIGGLMLQQMMGAKGIEFDGRKFAYVGVPQVPQSVCVLTKASGVASVEQWFAAKEPLKLGGVGPGGNMSDIARTLKTALGLPIRVVDGYKGAADVRLSADSGELAGFCLTWDAVKIMLAQALETGNVSVVLQAAPKKHPELPNVPLAVEFAKTDEARQLLKYAVHDVTIIQYLYFLPPGTPKEHLQMLRKAFLETLEDPEFLADARKGNMTIGPVPGEEIENVVSGLFKIDAKMVAKLKTVLVP
jgi:tripartite-type tricarboxylate transporter receptor subunit TctC